MELKSGALLMMMQDTQARATHAAREKEGTEELRFSLNFRFLKIREKVKGIPCIGGEQKKVVVETEKKDRR